MAKHKPLELHSYQSRKFSGAWGSLRGEYNC